MRANEFKVDKKVGSILEEITELYPVKSRAESLSSRADHLIQSAINLLEDFKSHLGEEQADYLEKKLLNSIKAREPEKFARLFRKSQND